MTFLYLLSIFRISMILMSPVNSTVSRRLTSGPQIGLATFPISITTGRGRSTTSLRGSQASNAKAIGKTAELPNVSAPSQEGSRNGRETARLPILHRSCPSLGDPTQVPGLSWAPCPGTPNPSRSQNRIKISTLLKSRSQNRLQRLTNSSRTPRLNASSSSGWLRTW